MDTKGDVVVKKTVTRKVVNEEKGGKHNFRDEEYEYRDSPDREEELEREE